MGADRTRVAQHVRGTTAVAGDVDHEDATSWSIADTAERERVRVRNCVCAMLCVFATAAVLALFGSALATACAPTRPMRAVLERVQHAAAVQFAVEFNASSAGRHSGTAPARALFSGSVVRVNGSLIPRTSEDSGQLRFDGWVHVETSARERHDLVLKNHRGYCTVRALPSLAVVREGCVDTHDVPPLHALEGVPRSAFYADADASMFGAHCMRGRAIELLFMDVPFVMCTDELFPSAGSVMEREAAGTSHTLVFHGKHVRVRATLMGERVASEGARLQTEALSVPSTCRYLEAPLSTGRPKRSFLYHVLPPR